MNGRLALIRTLASSAISLVAVAGSIWLLHDGVQVPMYFWLLSALAVVGVTGADAVAAIREVAGRTPIPPPVESP